ncbi:MAG: lipopolysaccharide heptosyltransferase II, partial [Psittacicella sp.]
LKKRYKDSQIDVISVSWSCDILKRMPEIDNVLISPTEHKKLSFMARYRFGKSLRDKYDVAFILPNSFKSALIPYFAKIKTRIGWLGEFRYPLLTDIRKDQKRYKLCVRRYVSLAYSKDQIPKDDFEFIYPELSLAKDKVLETLLKYNIDKDFKFIAICPGAAFGPAKCWPDNKYKDLFFNLINKGYSIVLLGSKSDSWIGDKIMKDFVSISRVKNLISKTSLLEVSYIIEAASFVVSNDSGLMHIGCALNRKTVVLYGPTSPSFTPPLNIGAKIINLLEDRVKLSKKERFAGYHKSMEDITSKMVYEKLQEFEDF